MITCQAKNWQKLHDLRPYNNLLGLAPRGHVIYESALKLNAPFVLEP